MELTRVPDVGDDEAAALGRAGVETVEDLRHANVASLSEATGLDADRLRALVAAARDVRVLTDVPGMTASAARHLEEADVAHPDALRDADADALAEATGLDAEYLRRLQDAVDAADLKVLLNGDAGEARVRLRGDWHDAVPILTAHDAEDVDQVLQDAQGDVVVLVAGAEAAVVRVDDVAFESVPIYKTRPVTRDDGTTDVEEVRVRVQAIREKRAGAEEPAVAPADVEEAPEKKGGFVGRFFGRKKD